ncbi:MAG: dTMP kinase [Nitrososphaerales archaeon]
MKLVLKDFKEQENILIAFEGIDASGKNTQSTLLHSKLRSMKLDAEYVSFPDYTTTIGQEIRSFLSGEKSYPLEARHMLYSLNRYEHKNQIENWQSEGKIIVINRYCVSNLAYGGASGLSIDWLRSLESQMPQADYIFYLRATPNLSKLRKSNRDKFESDLSFLSRVSSVYDALSQSPNWFKIDADDSIENIQYEIFKITEELLRSKR